jgi:hypothetical protein
MGIRCNRWPVISKFAAGINQNRRPGRGMPVWITTDVDMTANEATEDLTHPMGMVDTANGVVPRLGL